MRALIVLLLVSSTTLTVVGRPLSQTPETQLSASESQEVEQFAQAVSKRLRLTRDLSPFLTEPPASTVLDKVLLDKEDSLPLVSQDLISTGNLNELRKFWIATLNLAYLSELYVYTRMSVKGVRTYELPHAQQYPPAVVRTLKRDPVLSEWWKESDSDSSDRVAKNTAQLRHLTKTFQKSDKSDARPIQGASTRTNSAVSEEYRLLVGIFKGCGR